MTQPKTITEAIAGQLTKTKYERQMDAIKLIPQALQAALSLGLDKDESIQGANRAVAVITGINVIELFKVKAPATATEEKYLTLGQIGHRMKTNWQTVSKRLRSIGMLDEYSFLTESGRAFYVEGKGWSEKVIELLQEKEAV